MNLLRSKQRVADHGEVFTPTWLVEAMLDLVKEETRLSHQEDYCKGIYGTDFLVEHERKRYAPECKFNVQRDMYKAVRIAGMLHRAGFRFTVNGLLNKSLPGKPDLVFPRSKIAVFVHRCFSHRHVGCKYAYTPKSRVEFWVAKFKKHVERDLVVSHKLTDTGWQQFVIWECELKTSPHGIVERFKAFVASHTAPVCEGGKG